MVEAMVEKALLTDGGSIHRLVNSFAARGIILPRSLSGIYGEIHDYVVCRVGNEVVGCAALHILWEDQAELRAVAVREDMQSQGIGSSLIQACLDEARDMGISNILLLTNKPDYFGRFGFRSTSIETLPLILWRECSNCPKYPANCDEVAMKFQLTSV